MFNRCYRLNYVTLALSGLLTLSSQAQDPQEDSIEKIAVWSTQVKSSSMYLNSQEISNKQADHISDLLRVIPGVDVGGAHSLNQRITIRSMDDKDLNITIDGATQNTYMYHHMGNLQIHADILKSVEIETGSNSILTTGLGGSVRFKTKDAADLLLGKQNFGARLQAGAGNNSGHNFSLTGYGLLSDNLDVLAYINTVSKDNYEVGGGEILDASGSKVDDTNGEVKGFAGDVHDALLKFGWNITNNQRLSLGYETYQDEGQYSYRPDMGLATDLAITDALGIPLLWPTEFSRDTLTLNYRIEFSDNADLHLSAFSNISELWRDETGYAENESYAGWAAVVTGEAKNTGINAIGEILVGQGISHHITYGLEHVKHQTSYQAVYNSATDVSSEQATNTAIYLQNRIALNSQFTLIPGVRIENYELDAQVVSNDYSATSLAFAFEYQPLDSLLFKLSKTELFKGPEIGEVFIGAGLFDTENADIKAESGHNSEFAVAFQDNVLGADVFSAGITLFNTSIDNYIYDYAQIPGGGARDLWKDNVGNMHIEGFEAYLGYQRNHLEAQLTYSSAESELDAFADYLSIDKARIDRQQGDTISADIQYLIENLNMSLAWETMHVRGVDNGLNLDGASLSNAKDNFTVHNISLNWQPAQFDGLTFILGIDNLLNEYYASQSSRTGVSFHPLFGELYLLDYEPGRNLKATIAYQF